jgi:hypothetical protein
MAAAVAVAPVLVLLLLVLSAVMGVTAMYLSSQVDP